MGYVVSNLALKRTSELMKEHQWAELKAHLGDFADRRWIIYFHAASITFTHQKKRHHVRVSTDATIYVDRKITKFEFKSDVIRCADAAQASKEVRALLDELS